MTLACPTRRSSERRGIELARPGDGVDVEAERVLAEHLGAARRLDDGREDGGPAFGAGEAAALVDLLGPLHLERRVRGAHHARRSEEHTSELQSLMRISYAVFCLKKKHKQTH